MERDSYNICFTDVFNSMACAVNYLQDELKYEPDDVAEAQFNQTVDQMKKMISCYCEEQKTVFKAIRNCF